MKFLMIYKWRMRRFDDFLINNYIDYIDKNTNVSEIDKERIKFAIAVLIKEVKKYLIIIFIFLLMDKILPLIISFLTLMSIRLELGGIHCKKNWQCVIVTFIYFFLTIISAETFRLSNYEIVTVEVVSFITILICTPINSNIRIVNDKKIVMKLKIRVSSVMLVILILINLISEKYRNYIVWSLFFILIEIIIHLFCEFRR